MQNSLSYHNIAGHKGGTWVAVNHTENSVKKVNCFFTQTAVLVAGSQINST